MNTITPPPPRLPTLPDDNRSSLKRLHPSLLIVAQILIPAAILLLIAIGMVTGYLQKFLWMRELHFTGIFWTLFLVQWAMFAAAFAVVFLFMGFNLRLALQNSGAFDPARPTAHQIALSSTNDLGEVDIDLSPKFLNAGVVIVSLGFAWLAADGFFSQWDTFLRFRYGGAFGVIPGFTCSNCRSIRCCKPA
jgi:uncharacterized membrane protein (UPF0182 family)